MQGSKNAAKYKAYTNMAKVSCTTSDDLEKCMRNLQVCFIGSKQSRIRGQEVEHPCNAAVQAKSTQSAFISCFMCTSLGISLNLCSAFDSGLYSMERELKSEKWFEDEIPILSKLYPIFWRRQGFHGAPKTRVHHPQVPTCKVWVGNSSLKLGLLLHL